MAPDNQKYCIDTSALLDLRPLDPDVFSGVWSALSDLGRQGILHAPSEVFRELSKTDDIVFDWAKKNKGIFFDPNQALVDKVILVQEKFKFYDIESEKPAADPFLVAHGIISGCTVVTNEKEVGPDSKKIKIPNACKHFGVKFLTLSEFFRELGISFVSQKK